LRHLSGEDDPILAQADPHRMITVLIARDTSLVHVDPSTPLCEARGLWVLGTVADHSEVIRAVHILQPDVLVIESMRLSASAVKVTQQITAGGVHTRVVIVSMRAAQASLTRTLRSGVAGVVLRPFERDELVHAVREAANGRHHLSPRLWRALEGQAEKMRNAVTVPAGLSAIERRILGLAAAGHGATGMSARLSMPRPAIEGCRRTLMQKLGLRTHRDLAVYALRWHIVAAQQSSPASLQDFR
jgi:DNA-binding NarL/FixJ family response regulator